MRCMYFLGACLEHFFAGRELFTLSALVNTDSNTREKEMLCRVSSKILQRVFINRRVLV